MIGRLAIFLAVAWTGIGYANPMVVEHQPEAVPLSIERQYYYEVSCSVGIIDADNFLSRTNRDGRFATAQLRVSAQTAAHFLLLSGQNQVYPNTFAGAQAIVSDTNSKWIQVFFESRDNGFVSSSGVCANEGRLLRTSRFYAHAFFAFDVSSNEASRISSALLTLASQVQTALVAHRGDIETSGEGVGTLDTAQGIVNAYNTFESTFARNGIISEALELREGVNTISTGYSQVMIEITPIESYLTSHLPFRSWAWDIVDEVTGTLRFESDFSSTLRLRWRGLLATEDPVDVIRAGCEQLDTALRRAGYVSPSDRAYLLAAFLRGANARTHQRVICFEELELTREIMDPHIVSLIASPNGLGPNATIGLSDLDQVRDLYYQ